MLKEQKDMLQEERKEIRRMFDMLQKQKDMLHCIAAGREGGKKENV